ncbi:MAG: PEP-CTERM sorting domain-containing protein, partial [Phycisphaerae bacterium]|nr:PEP-CTERM sorting domain-containing protein [Phycisphaerae bacterium]
TIPIPGGNGEIPVPGGGGDPVPEPATIALLGLGAVLFLRRRPQ